MYKQNEEIVDHITEKIGYAVDGEPESEAIEALINILLYIAEEDPDKIRQVASVLTRIAASEDPSGLHGLRVVD